MQEPPDANVNIYATEPPASYEPSNPDARMVGFTTILDTGEAARLVVDLIPGTADGASSEIISLSNW